MKLKAISYVAGAVVWCASLMGLQGWIMKKWSITSCDEERKKEGATKDELQRSNDIC